LETLQVSGLSINGGDAGNYTLTQPTLTADITAASSATPWVNVSTNTAGTDGTWTFEDSTALPQRFYRSAKP
jgi:hypothetical protein